MKKHSYEEIIKIIKKKKFKKIFTFGQSRGGTTFCSYILAKELGYLKYFVPEEISNHLNFKRLFIELLKNEKIYIHCHHNVFKRKQLNNNETIFIFIYRHHKEIINSFKKTKKRNSNFDFHKDIKNRVLKKIKNTTHSNGPKYLNDLWMDQKNYFKYSYTLDFNSLKKHPMFLKEKKRDQQFKSLKQISKNFFFHKDNFGLLKFKDENQGFKYLKLVILYLVKKLKNNLI